MADIAGKLRKGLTGLAVVLGAAPFFMHATAEAADTVAGKALALQWCASCHLVSNDQSSASSVSLPSFYDMSKDPNWNAEKLSTFLANPHPQMPDMTLGNIEITNLAAYIQSLKTE